MNSDTDERAGRGDGSGGTIVLDANVDPPRWWLVVIPCVLALPAAALGALSGLVSSLFSCFDTCTGYTNWFNSPNGEGVLGLAELVFGLISFVLLIIGLAVPRNRRVLMKFAWIICLLASAILGILYSGA